jgi:CRP-like cAMP-binding protein
MDLSLLISHITEYVALSDAEIDFLGSILIQRPFKQGEVLIHAGEAARYMVFVNDGHVMTYFTDDDANEHVMQFAATGWWAGDIYSISHHTTTKYSTRGLGNGEVLLLPRIAHQQLLEKFPTMERYFRMHFQNALIRQQLRFIESYTTTSEERYQKFVDTYPTLERFVAQKHIASYLGITPQFLSRIRKRIAEK